MAGTKLFTSLFTKVALLSLLIVCCFTNGNTVYANGIKKIAILPFEIHSEKDITHIQHGIKHMLSSRLSWTGHTAITDKRTIVNALGKNSSLAKDKFLPAMAKTTDSDYVLTGSITEFADAFSIDARIYNIEDQTSVPFFAQADEMNKIIPEISLLAAKINKKIFDRATERYEEFTEEQSYAKQRQIQQRMDPEKMLPPQRFEPEEDHRPWWNVWKYF
jgi:TolB-like protein